VSREYRRPPEGRGTLVVSNLERRSSNTGSRFVRGRQVGLKNTVPGSTMGTTFNPQIPPVAQSSKVTCESRQFLRLARLAAKNAPE
jgi:hypothetical protein